MAATRRNPVFWLIWLILGAAVFAGVGMVAIAMQGADRALPSLYHWEGERLDADFERARVAARLGIVATLRVAAGQCTLALDGAPATEAVQLQFTSGTDARLDRAVVLHATTQGGGDYDFAADCDGLPRGRWRLAMQDAGATWSIRGQAEDLTNVHLRARDPDGGP